MKWYKEIAKVLPTMNVKKAKSSKGTFYNVPCSFDIETSSFIKDNEKTAVMYVWQFAFDNETFYGRTWEQYQEFIEYIEKTMKLGHPAKLVIYVHNLGYEFQFMRKYFKWEKIFADKNREPIYADTGTIQYRCSYRLSGYSLAKLAENLKNKTIKKLVGDLDYRLIRHTSTPLTEKELEYCENDVLIVTEYIREQIEENGNITKIPLTSTGFVRRYCREHTIEARNINTKLNYRALMKRLNITSLEEYKSLKDAFQGGFTHASHFHTKEVAYNISSYDFTSSYPAVMLSELFPMSSATVVEPSSQLDLDNLCEAYCVIMNIVIANVKEKFPFEHYISAAHCFVPEKILKENGRIVSADKIGLTITDVDYELIKATYDFDLVSIGTCYKYNRGYLPKPFIESILHLYEQKNLLKGVKGKEVEYLKSKGMLNSCYGMCVTDIVRNSYVYDNEGGWEKEKLDTWDSLEKYNNDKKRFLFYPWGVWVTAYARSNLWTGIMECGYDYIYSDTDSVKIRNKEKHAEYFKRYNDNIRIKLKKMCDTYHINFSRVEPKGKLLGVWDYEGDYSRFKTLGAKRYMTEKEGQISFTVAGCNKKVAVPYLLDKFGQDGIWDAFDDSLYIDGEHTGKLTHSYIDDEMCGSIVDYTGKQDIYDQLSGIHLEPCSFTLSMTADYLLYLAGCTTNIGRIEVGGGREHVQ